MNVVLINPPNPESNNPDMKTGYPLGLLYLAARLEDHHIPVKVLDLIQLRSWERVLSEITAARPTLIGIRSLTLNRGTTYRLIEDLQARLPGVKIILGGPHASIMYQQLLQTFNLEGVFIGEAEDSLIKFISVMGNRAAYREIPGFAFIERGIVHCNPIDQAINSDLDRISIPAYHQVDLTQYAGEDYKFHIVTSRGCPFKCKFCAIPSLNNTYRRHSVPRVIREIEQLHALFPQEKMQLYIHDDLFQLKGRWTEQLCEAILSLPFKVSWIVRSRGDHASAQTLSLMRAAGCEMISIGLESGSATILARMDKRLDIHQTRNTIQLIKSAGIKVSLYLILGYPGETFRTMSETLRVVKQVRPYKFSISLPILLPGTTLCEEARCKGRFDERYWLENTRPTCPVYSDLPTRALIVCSYLFKLLGEEHKLDLLGRALIYYRERGRKGLTALSAALNIKKGT